MQKKRCVQRGLFIVLLLLAFFNNQYSRPFTIQSPVTTGYHETIVNMAFIGMSTDCLLDIINANRSCDLSHTDNHELHFTDGGWNAYAWEKSVTCIRNWMANAIDQLMKHIDYSETRKCLGMASHPIADFFSHSNWVENNGQTINGLAFEPGQMPAGWETIMTSALVMEKDHPDDEGGEENFWKAFNAAVEMTKKEFDDFEKRLFDLYPDSRELIYARLLELGVPPTLKINKWAEVLEVQKIGRTQIISWDHIGIDPDSQILISLLKNGSEIGNIAEVPTSDRQFSWQGGRYYTKAGETKEWHDVDPFESNASYKIRIISYDKSDARSNSDEFKIKDFYFTNPLENAILFLDQNVNITWRSSDFPGPGADLFLYQNTTKIGKITSLLDVTGGIYTWNVGEYGNKQKVSPGSDFEVRIRFIPYPGEACDQYEKFSTSTGKFKIVKPKITGYVRYANGVGVPNVRMAGLPSEPLTDSNGHYSVNVNYGWSGNVCAVKDGLFILPWVRSYTNVKADQTGQNYTARINISGYVRTAAGAGIDGVRLWDLSPDATTSSNGSYSGSVDYGWDGSATPVKPGYVFSPVSRNYSNVQTPKTNQNFTGTACTYAISPASATIPASGGSGSIQVTAPGGCPWTASSNRAWITITSGASGKGNGTVQYQVARNTSGVARSGSITVQGKTFSLTQQK